MSAPAAQIPGYKFARLDTSLKRPHSLLSQSPDVLHNLYLLARLLTPLVAILVFANSIRPHIRAGWSQVTAMHLSFAQMLALALLVVVWNLVCGNWKTDGRAIPRWIFI